MQTVILDEADQMLKQGFKEEVDKVSILTIFDSKSIICAIRANLVTVSVDLGCVQATMWKRSSNLSIFRDNSKVGQRCRCDTYEAIMSYRRSGLELEEQDCS